MSEEDTSATLAILNVGDGDTKLSFDKDKPIERERAARIVGEMLKRGYAIMVQVDVKDGDPFYARARSFDPQTCEYVIMGLSEAEEAEIADKMSGKKKRQAARRVDAMRAPAVAVARTARGCARESW